MDRAASDQEDVSHFFVAARSAEHSETRNVEQQIVLPTDRIWLSSTHDGRRSRPTQLLNSTNARALLPSFGAESAQLVSRAA